MNISQKEIKYIVDLYDNEDMDIPAISELTSRPAIEITNMLHSVGALSDEEFKLILYALHRVEQSESNLDSPYCPETALITNAFKEYGIQEFWHLTHASNITGILRAGILSHRNAHKVRVNETDISMESAQARRERLDGKYNRRVHDYVPLYINPKNPMLYARQDLQNDLCLLAIDTTILASHEFLLSDGNVASAATKLFSSVNQLNELPWSVLSAPWWNDIPDGKRKRCAEVLVYPHVEPRYIKKICCFSEQTRNSIHKLHCDVVVDRNRFFC